MIDPAHLEGGDGKSMQLGLRLWSSHNSPILYNDFQSLYFQLMKMGYEDEGAPDVETSAERQVRMKAMYQEVQSEIHGSEHLVLAATAAAAEKAEKAKALAAVRREELASRLQGSAERAPEPEHATPMRFYKAPSPAQPTQIDGGGGRGAADDNYVNRGFWGPLE